MQLIGESEIDSLSIVLCKSGIIGARKVSNCLMVKRWDCIKKGEKVMKYVEPEMETSFPISVNAPQDAHDVQSKAEIVAAHRCTKCATPLRD